MERKMEKNIRPIEIKCVNSTFTSLNIYNTSLGNEIISNNKQFNRCGCTKLNQLEEFRIAFTKHYINSIEYIKPERYFL